RPYHQADRGAGQAIGPVGGVANRGQYPGLPRVDRATRDADQRALRLPRCPGRSHRAPAPTPGQHGACVMNALANALAVDLSRALAEGGAAERARRSLREYVRQAWHVVEPSTPYVHGWHIDA